jgi:glycosyltransferase involved in cell wall biosynthesis
MGTEPLVSVVMNFLNAEPFIEEAIASVQAQGYASWELLLVDDGSTDGSTAIARHHAACDPDRVRYFEHPRHENRGTSASRNRGIHEARGAYVSFLDADDTWSSCKLEAQVQLLEAYPEAAMVYGRTLIWHGWTGRSEDAARDHFFDLGVPSDTLVRPPTLFLLLLANKAQTPTMCNAIVRRHVLERVGGFEESFRALYDDQVLFFKIDLEWPVFVADACWARYRQHAGSCTAALREDEYHAARRPLLDWLGAYLSERGIGDDTEIWRAFQRELWPVRHPTLQRLLSAPRRLADEMRGRARARLRRAPWSA